MQSKLNVNGICMREWDMHVKFAGTVQMYSNVPYKEGMNSLVATVVKRSIRVCC